MNIFFEGSVFFTNVNEFQHYSVMLNECIDLLNIKANGIYIDGTAGGGGHSRKILNKLSKQQGRLICFDKDPDALKRIHSLFGQESNVFIVDSDFKYIPERLDVLKILKVDGILLDLGVSSYQIDMAERGFCYNKDADLDMRMSKSGLSAYDIVNFYSVEDLTKIIYEYGEEKCAKRIAYNIEKFRIKKPIKRTFDLCDIIKNSIPAAMRRSGGNPCKRTFQAIRIAVNDELESLSECLDKSFDRLNVGGRFCVITFQSLEDRIVKHKFAELARGCICPPDFPICVCGKKSRAKLITRKPVLPLQNELDENSRSQSAKLRVIEKL